MVTKRKVSEQGGCMFMVIRFAARGYGILYFRFALFHALNGTSLHTLEEIASDVFPGTIWEPIVYDGSYKGTYCFWFVLPGLNLELIVLYLS